MNNNVRIWNWVFLGNMKLSALFYLAAYLLICVRSDQSEDISVKVDLLGMDLEDYCDKLAFADKNVLLKLNNSWSEKIEIEKDFASFTRKEAENLHDTFYGQTLDLSANVKRHLEIFEKLGDIELLEEDSNQIITFKNTLAQLSNELEIACSNSTINCMQTKTDIRKILSDSRDVKELQTMWTTSQNVFLPYTNQYFDLLKLVNKAAKINGFTKAEDYWEMLVEHPDAYKTAETLWQEIEPFYKKFQQFVKSRIDLYYDEFQNVSFIPIYLLGPEFSTDWSSIASIILPHRYLYDEITSMLDFEKIGGKKQYEIAEKFISGMGMKKAGAYFWKTSVFNQQCPSHLLTFCADKHSSVVTCNSTGWTEYMNSHEDMMRVALNNRDYPAAAFNPFRISALDEAIVGLGSILAIKNLPLAGIVPENVFLENEDKNQNQMSALLLMALRILPRLPYYLLSDLWRLKQLKNESEDAVADWWTYKKQMQGVGGVSNTEPDFLSDQYITSNKPYIGKFFGTILQFQLLEHFQNQIEDGVNILHHIGQDENFKSLLSDRTKFDWPKALSDNFYLDLSASSLLTYFQPLEHYLETAPKTQITDTVRPKTMPPSTTPYQTQPTTPKPTIRPQKPAPTTIKPTTLKSIQEDAPKPNLIDSLLELTKPKFNRENPTVFAAKPKENVKKEESGAANVGVWVGGLVGIGALVVIVGIVAKRKCRRKPVTANRRPDVV